MEPPVFTSKVYQQPGGDGVEGGDDHEGDLHGEEHRDHHDQHHRRAVRVPLPPGVAAPATQAEVSTEFRD